jgi:hypothetical protein
VLPCAAMSDAGVAVFESLEVGVVRPRNCVQPMYKPAATTAAAATPSNALLLPPPDDSGASAAPNKKDGEGAPVTKPEESFMPDPEACSNGTSAPLATLDVAGSTTVESAGDRAGAAALAAPVPKAGLPVTEATFDADVEALTRSGTRGALVTTEDELDETTGTDLEIGGTGTFLTAGLNPVGETAAAFHFAAAGEVSWSRSSGS